MTPRVLHVAAEAFPLVKTGGLADVAGALPPALVRAGADVRLLLPGLPAIAEALRERHVVCELGPLFGAARATLVRGTLPDIGVPAYVLDAPFLYRRGGVWVGLARHGHLDLQLVDAEKHVPAPS